MVRFLDQELPQTEIRTGLALVLAELGVTPDGSHSRHLFGLGASTPRCQIRHMVTDAIFQGFGG